MRAFLFLILIGLICLFSPRESKAFELGMPLKCHYGTDCFIQNYFDDDPSKAAKDYQHGHLSYDGHDGTDFRIRNYTAMQQGVDVIAAAEGMVKTVRDEMEDINVNKIGKETVMSKGCGNAVVLLHEDHYNSFYCHMKKGSVAVKPGDHVKRGQKLGEIGLSGLTEFPHVHLGVMRKGKKLDPFTAHLWDKDTAKTLSYIPTGLLNSEFSAAPPEPEAARAGKFTLTDTSTDTPALIFWVDVFGLQPNDALTLSILDPKAKVVAEKTFLIDRYKALFFQYIGKKNSNASLMKGRYTGKVLLKREGKTVIDEVRKIVVR